MSNPDINFERQADLNLYDKFHCLYNEYFAENTEADWVMISDRSEEILGGGNDDQLPTEESLSELQAFLGQTVHIFGKPGEASIDGQTFIFE